MRFSLKNVLHGLMIHQFEREKKKRRKKIIVALKKITRVNCRMDGILTNLIGLSSHILK